MLNGGVEAPHGAAALVAERESVEVAFTTVRQRSKFFSISNALSFTPSTVVRYNSS
jgi:hypothetical protein